jgi:hypothetical protein
VRLRDATAVRDQHGIRMLDLAAGRCDDADTVEPAKRFLEPGLA